MTTSIEIMKSNDNFAKANIELPLPPDDQDAPEMEIYARFMRHLRMVPNNQKDIKVLSAIQFTADILDISDALISKTLVGLGLRAPRSAFPAEYLNFVDKSMLRSGWLIGGRTESVAALKEFWDKIGEDKYAAYRRDVVALNEYQPVDV